MLLNKMLELIDKNPGTLKQYVFDIDCLKSPCFWKNKDPVKKCVF